MEWLPLGIRDVILLLVVGAALYLVYVVLKLVQVGRRHGVPPVGDGPGEPPREPSAAPTFTPQEPIVSPYRAIRTYEDLAAEAVAAESGPPAAPPPPAVVPASSGSGFGEHIGEHLLRTEMEGEMQQLREEIENLRRELEEVRAARRVSPQYSEAMELVQRGKSAQEVSDHLGISLAEAELVQALSRGQTRLIRD